MVRGLTTYMSAETYKLLLRYRKTIGYDLMEIVRGEKRTKYQKEVKGWCSVGYWVR